MRTHPDLSSKLLPGWNAVDGSNDTSDIHGHGTAVAGTAAAHTNNANGVAGVASNAAILPVRITNTSDGYAYWSDIARGLTWAADQGADVANISYGVPTAQPLPMPRNTCAARAAWSWSRPAMTAPIPAMPTIPT